MKTRETHVGQMDTSFIAKDTDAIYYQNNDTGKVHTIKYSDFVEVEFTVKGVDHEDKTRCVHRYKGK